MQLDEVRARDRKTGVLDVKGVWAQPEAPAGAGADIAAGRFYQWLPAARRHDIGAGLGQPERDGAADAGGAADDDGDTPGEVK